MPNILSSNYEKTPEKSLLFAYQILIAKAFLSGKIAGTNYFYLFFTDGNFQEKKFEDFVQTFVQKNLFLDQKWIQENFGSSENIDNILSLGSDFEFSGEFLTILRTYLSQKSQYPSQKPAHFNSEIASYVSNKMTYTIEIDQIIESMKLYVNNLITQKK